MGNLVSISHKTVYRYDRTVNLGPQLIRLRPAAHSRTRVLSYSLTVRPENHFINWLQDPYGNFQARVLFPQPVRELVLEVALSADLAVYNPFDFFLEPAAETVPFTLDPALRSDLAPYLGAPDPGPRLSAYLKGLPPPSGRTIDFLVGLNQRLAADVRYNIRLEPNVQSSEDTLTLGSGSCRDSAVLLVDLLRTFGFAARFVSGYLIQLKADQRPLTGPSGPEADFTDLHAWAEAYVPGAGWIGLDPTSGLLTGEGHIPLAATPRPSGAAPLEGVLDPCEVTFHHEMTVTRLADGPRASMPFAGGSREALERLGTVVDARLAAGGHALTIGGEPTFVSEENRNAPEWNSDALGPTKKPMALDLMDRLGSRWAPGGVLHSSQGKWYPGESLPRWALGCYWRKDGVPVWKDPSLRGDERLNAGLVHTDALRFLTALVGVLGVDPKYILEAYEDPMHFLARERDLPVNVTPGDPKLANPEDRHRMVQVFHHGLHNPTGFVLPLQKGSWKSGPWPLRGGKLVLIPGDSPIGLRLPLDSLPWADEAERQAWNERDPFEDVGFSGTIRTKPLRSEKTPPAAEAQKTNPMPLPEEHPPLVPGESAAWVVRSALCAQVRDGNLYLFLPPVRKADDWFALVAEIEKTASQTGLRPILEGYTPPYGDDFASFQITPDPGVIEVNLPPAADSPAWSALLDDLWDQAAVCGLSPVKFLTGGQVTGSGGGCHWVLGGPVPARSPFLKRPDLLRSWILFLNRHPSLTYFFSGLFVGATSQAPRFDESHPDGHEDLELAFTELDGRPVTPWLTDRIFRNLMVDGVGNTHRTELCIDKLFSPDRASGRLGLVEFRSFEMAPHRDMALAFSQLLKALTLRFLEAPYRQPLVRWGTALKDQWMLPWFLEADLNEVLADLDASGLVFPREPFAAQRDFRFPVVGTLGYGPLEVEVRQALEPWPVMGEEGGGGGTVRYVDSSVERLQIRVSGLDPGRYALACRGLRLPLVPDAQGTAVCGLRFKAWKLASGLHPTLEATPKVVIDVVDLVSRATVAGCTVHVAHPAGRNYEEPPVNSFEAEARRQARFETGGFTPGPLTRLPALVHSTEFPHTLSIHGHRQASGNLSGL